MAASAPRRLWYALRSNLFSGESRQPFSTEDNSHKLQNLLINKNTRIIYQGFTGLTATGNARDALSNGTKVVGGVSPGKGGRRHLDLPVFDTVSEATRNLNPDASLIYVPARGAASAMIEAIAAEVPLIVSLAEHVPVHDMLRVHEVLRTQQVSQLLGPNCPGLIAPSKCRIGIIPYNQCSPGHVGVISRSGTMIYEALGATKAAGLGQSLVIGLGGDSMPGTTMREALELLLSHEETHTIILIGEIGGNSEFEVAELIRAYRARTANPKPVIAIISGRTAPAGKVMGHAGALLASGEQGAEAKAHALQDAGALVIPHLGALKVELERCSSSWTESRG